MLAGRLMERGSALIERGSSQNLGVPAGPEAIPTPASNSAPAPGDAERGGGVANLASNPTPPPSTPTQSVDSIDLSTTPIANSTSVGDSSSAATATSVPSLGISIPTSLSTVIPATVAFLGFCILGLVVYNVWRWRKRRAERKRKVNVLPQIVVSYEKSEFASKSPGLIRTDGSVDAGSTPILIAFPTSGNDDNEAEEKKSFSAGLPASPKPAAKPNTTVRHDAEANWRPIPRVKGTTPRANARTSSLVHSHSIPDIERLIAAEPLQDAAARSKVPRLATVMATFATTLPDELEVRMGETLRVLEDYADGWCLAERVSGGKPQRGALPQFCLQDKADLVPGKRFSLFGRK